jgi:hypothetical protein
VNDEVERAASLMRDFPGPWGIAGGWAIDLFAGRESRPHVDVDVALLRADQRHLRRRLIGARVEKVVAHTLIYWAADEELQPPVHEVHVTWPDGHHLEFLLNDHDPRTGDWIYRRDPRVRRPLAATFLMTSDVAVLAPEIVLLYKSKASSGKDDADLGVAVPYLHPEQRAWLRSALQLTAPGHRWLDTVSPDR